jgi:osmotically-inducible protein OsmY
MRNFTSHVALASQLFVVSAGLSLVLPAVAAAQTPAVTHMSKADRDLTKNVRKAIVSDKSLSVAAHNVHIAAQDGSITLTGTVKSDEEKKAVEDKATEVAGAGKVTDNLTVSGNNQ